MLVRRAMSLSMASHTPRSDRAAPPPGSPTRRSGRDPDKTRRRRTPISLGIRSPYREQFYPRKRPHVAQPEEEVLQIADGLLHADLRAAAEHHPGRAAGAMLMSSAIGTDATPDAQADGSCGVLLCARDDRVVRNWT